MSAHHELDVTGLAAPAALSVIAKATRYMARGTTVAVSTPDHELATEIEAWAAWAGHLTQPDALRRIVTVRVREGERLSD